MFTGQVEFYLKNLNHMEMYVSSTFDCYSLIGFQVPEICRLYALSEVVVLRCKALANSFNIDPALSQQLQC